MTYRHTQIGKLMIAGLGIAILATVLGIISEDGRTVAFWVAGVLGVCLAIFSTLTVSIEDGFVSCGFGPLRLFQKSIPLHEIANVRPVRNSWMAGWGIRWLGSGITMWNVSGLDAVELTLRSGKRFRIGTDQPRELVQALNRAIGSL